MNTQNSGLTHLFTCLSIGLCYLSVQLACSKRTYRLFFPLFLYLFLNFYLLPRDFFVSFGVLEFY